MNTVHEFNSVIILEKFRGIINYWLAHAKAVTKFGGDGLMHLPAPSTWMKSEVKIEHMESKRFKCPTR